MLCPHCIACPQLYAGSPVGFSADTTSCPEDMLQSLCRTKPQLTGQFMAHSESRQFFSGNLRFRQIVLVTCDRSVKTGDCQVTGNELSVINSAFTPQKIQGISRILNCHGPLSPSSTSRVEEATSKHDRLVTLSHHHWAVIVTIDFHWTHIGSVQRGWDAVKAKG